MVGDDIAVLPSQNLLLPSQNKNIAATNDGSNIVTEESNNVTNQLPGADQLDRLLCKDEGSLLPPLPLPKNWGKADPKVSKISDEVRGVIVA